MLIVTVSVGKLKVPDFVAWMYGVWRGERRGMKYVFQNLCLIIFRDVMSKTGFTAAKDRCVSKAACQVQAERSDFLIYKKLAGEAISENFHDSQFVLTGTGEVAEYQGHALGLYTFNNNTGYFVQEGGDYYLVKDRVGWFTFPRISGCFDRTDDFSCIAFYVANLKTVNLRGETWSFGKDKTWIEDKSIKFTPFTNTSCLLCNTVHLSSSGPAMQERPEFFGTFERTSAYSAGRPVYKNQQGKFLMMMNEYTTFSVWDDMERTVTAGEGVEGVRGIRSFSGPTCITDLASDVQDMNTKQEDDKDKEEIHDEKQVANDNEEFQAGVMWQFLTLNGEWVDDASILLQVDCFGQ